MKKTGLALGGGGARGYAHIGIIKVLIKHNIPIDVISGTSIGSIVGAYYALNKNVDYLEKIALDFKKNDLLKFLDMPNPRESLIKGKKIREFLEQIFEGKSFRNTKIPLRICATDLTTGKRHVFKSGKIIDAVMASCAIPGIFPGVKLKNEYHVDGGLAENLPVSLVEELGVDIIIGVSLYSYKNFSKMQFKLKNILARTYQIYMTKLNGYVEKTYKKNTIIIKPKTGEGIEVFAFHHARENILAGMIEAKKALPKIKRLLK